MSVGIYPRRALHSGGAMDYKEVERRVESRATESGTGYGNSSSLKRPDGFIILQTWGVRIVGLPEIGVVGYADGLGYWHEGNVPVVCQGETWQKVIQEMDGKCFDRWAKRPTVDALLGEKH